MTLDEAGVIQKFGVSPASIPDYLALVGDAADGYPGLPGWGAKSSAAVLAKFGHLESIPADWREWRVNAANASALADTLCRERDRALLFRTLATLRTDIALFDDVDQLRWKARHPPSTRSRRDSTRRVPGSGGLGPAVLRARPLPDLQLADKSQHRPLPNRERPKGKPDGNLIGR